jgi:hypothetical protein
MREPLHIAICVALAACATAGERQQPSDGNVDAVDPLSDSASVCGASAEVCNDTDDDCDGMIDEGFDGVVELCNGVDDDCHNGIDDTFPVGQACTVGLGACSRTGSRACDSAGTGTHCDAIPAAPMAELCGDGIDDDCNGSDPACPSNDRPAGAIGIAAGGTFTADLTSAHDDNWAASTPELDCGEQGGRDVFYQFTLPAPEVVYFDTLGSNFDTVIRVFRGACSSLGATQACADDACGATRSQGAVSLLAGTYCLVVDQFNAATTAGSMQLVFKRGGRTGIPIAATSGVRTGTTTGKTNQSIAGCEASSSQPDEAYYFLTCPNRTYTVGANTCSDTDFDTVVYLRSGKATTADVSCSDDLSSCGNGFQSSISNVSIGGANLQWLIVDGFGQTGNGPYTLRYTIQ